MTTILELPDLIIAAVGMSTTLLLSGSVVRVFLKRLPDQKPRVDRSPAAGAIIGKCENMIAFTCVIADQLTGLAIIFAAKSLVRNSGESRDDDYYLCGTMVNLVWSLSMAYLTRYFLG